MIGVSPRPPAELRIISKTHRDKQVFREPAFEKILADKPPEPFSAPYTLLLDLEDFLVHSEWTREHGWRTAKRPGLDYFLGYLTQYYEV